MEKLPDATQILKTLMESEVPAWEKVHDNIKNGQNHLTSFRRHIPGRPESHMQLKLIETFPGVSADEFWEMASNTEKRI